LCPNINSPKVLAGLLLFAMPEASMNSTMAGRADERKGYRVEVSGWDAKEVFFVEKSTLAWTESAGKTISLKALIRIGSVLFVRVIQPLGRGSSFPVPYRVVESLESEAGERGSSGVITLERLQPRMASRETATHFVASASNVA
jgi:hypothetical protein